MNTGVDVRVGVVGCGGQGQALAGAVARSAQLRLVACADPDVDAARRVAGTGDGVGLHDSIEELLAYADVDAVLIATPHHLLAPVALLAIRAGKHLLIEKPVALNEAEASEVEFAAASAGVTCMAGYSFRYGMARKVQELYAAGAVGDLAAITGSIGAPRMKEGWTARPECGGGPLLYLGCHLVDLVLWLIAQEATSVSATVTRRPDTGLDDTSAIQLGFDGGRVAQLLVTQSAAGFCYDLRLIGAAGSIDLRGRDFESFEIEVHSSTLAAYAKPTVLRPGSTDIIGTVFVPELDDFADAIIQGQLPGVTASDARRVLRVLDAVHDSGRSGAPVALGPMLTAY